MISFKERKIDYEFIGSNVIYYGIKGEYIFRKDIMIGEFSFVYFFFRVGDWIWDRVEGWGIRF